MFLQFGDVDEQEGEKLEPVPAIGKDARVTAREYL
jgi:hypothetical protein